MFLELQREALGSSQVETGTSGIFSCCFREVRPLSSYEGDLGIPLESLQGKRTSSHIEAGIS